MELLSYVHEKDSKYIEDGFDDYEQNHKEHDQNLMFVYAVEGYAQTHNMPEKDVIALFKKHGINRLICDNYETLHTQDLDESISFAEDVLSWNQS